MADEKIGLVEFKDSLKDLILRFNHDNKSVLLGITVDVNLIDIPGSQEKLVGYGFKLDIG